MRGERTLFRTHMLAFIILVALPVAAVILVISLAFREEAVRIARNRTQEAVVRTAQSLDTEAQNFALFTSALSNDSSLMDNARTYVETPSPDLRFSSVKGMESSVSWFFRITSRIGSVFLFLPGGEHLYYSNYPATNVDYEAARRLCDGENLPPGEVRCLDDLSALPGGIDQPPVLSMVVRPRVWDSSSAESSIQSILVSFRIPLLDTLYSKTVSASDDVVSYVVNRAGLVILSNSRGWMGRRFSDIRAEEGRRSLIIEAPLESLGWIFAEAIPRSRFTRNVDRMMSYVYGAILLIALLFSLYSRAFFADTVKPLRSLVSRMGSVSDGDFSVRAKEEGPAEFRSLTHAFNSMVTRLDDLTAQIVEEQKERTKVEIEALRFQLNPHFLCNTLDAIGMMATMAKADPIKRMTVALTRIMRETLQADDTLFALEDELKNLDSYVYIMKIRFGDSFEYEVEIQEGLARAGIPTMLLQPLVENAILHGLRGRSEGHIVVAAQSSGDFLDLEVRDDGAGMDERTLASLFTPSTGSARGFNRIGLYNVRRRVVLSYGPPCDVVVSSYPGAGTVVSLRIPLMAIPHRDRDSSRPGDAGGHRG